MSMLAGHLEQINASAQAIAELEFTRPKIFTNALLNNPEITTLIRDTEPHERALFTLDPDAINSTRKRYTTHGDAPSHGVNRRKSMFPSSHPLKESAVTRVLGTDMLREIRQSSSGRLAGGVNVEVLLLGAQKLCEVYAVAGAQDKIEALYNRHQELATSIAGLGDKVSRQQSEVERKTSAMDLEDGADEDVMNPPQQTAVGHFTEDDLRATEDEIRELEARKQALEDRVTGIERDLGGLLR